MTDHNYYRNNEDLKSEIKQIRSYVKDTELLFKTDNGVFSKEYLDYATRILLENYEIDNDKALLDVGCGYGPIGIFYAKKYHANVLMVDINPRAIELVNKNIELNKINAKVLLSDCLDNIDDKKFDYIISNPPIRAGKQIIYKIYEQAALHLNENGKFVIIIQKHHGAESTIKKLKEIYKNVDTIYKKKGFYIIESKN